MVGLWCFAVALAGGLVGLVLGNIRLPALLLISSSPAAGAGANIGVSGIAAATAAVTQVRAGRIHWRVFWWMAPPSVVGAIIGELPSGIRDGLGGAILNFNQYYISGPPKLWAAIIVAAVVGIGFFAIVRVAEAIFLAGRLGRVET